MIQSGIEIEMNASQPQDICLFLEMLFLGIVRNRLALPYSLWRLSIVRNTLALPYPPWRLNMLLINNSSRGSMVEEVYAMF